MGTKNQPGKYDCYANAKPDEPMFILLARDPAAPRAVEKWADDRKRMIHHGTKPRSDIKMIREAEDCAQAMRDWRAANWPAAPAPSEPESQRQSE